VENLIYSLNATVPVFLVIVAGYLLKRFGMINDEFIKVSNRFNFTVTLPLLLIRDLMEMNFREEFELKYVLYCALTTAICFVTVWILARCFIKDKTIIGEFVQGAYRGSAAVLGTAFVLNLYGTTGMVPMMIIGAVPLYNIFAVIVLEMESPRYIEDGKNKGIDKAKIKKSLIGIIKNPMLSSIFVGVVLSLLQIDFPKMVDNTINNFAVLASPLALIAIGGSFETGKAIAKIKPAIMGSFIKLIGQAIIFLPVAIAMGFTGQHLMAIIIMLGAPTTPSCYIMAKGAGCDGALTTSMVVLTTVFSSFTITAMIFICKSMGLL